MYSSVFVCACLLLHRALPCSVAVAPATGVFVDSSAAGPGDGSECSPFQSLSVALAAYPSARFVLSAHSVVLSGQTTIAGTVAIDGAPTMLSLSGKVNVSGHLALTNIHVTQGSEFPDPLISCDHCDVSLLHVTFAGGTRTLAELFSGSVSLQQSTLQGVQAIAFVLYRAVAILSLAHSQVTDSAGLVVISAQAVEAQGLFSLDTVDFLRSGAVIHGTEVPAGGLKVVFQRVNIDQAVAPVLDGNLQNLEVEASDMTLTNSLPLISGRVLTSTISFSHCDFHDTAGPLFDLAGLQGFLSLTFSTVTDLSPGPVLALPFNTADPTTAVVTISHCDISKVTNTSPTVVCGVLIGFSMVFQFEHSEVWGVTTVECGLFKVTAGVAVVSDIYYHDSSVGRFCIFEGIMLMLSLDSLAVRRVANSEEQMSMCVVAGVCTMHNYTIAQASDPDLSLAPAFILFANAYGNVATVQNSYFNNPGSPPTCLGGFSDSVLNIFDTTIVEVGGPMVILSYTNTHIIVRNLTFVNTSADVLFYGYHSIPSFTVSEVHVTGRSKIGTFMWVDTSNAQVSNTALEGEIHVVFHAANTDLTLSGVTLSRVAGTVCQGCTNSNLQFTDVTVRDVEQPGFFDISYSVVLLTNLRLLNLVSNQVFTIAASTVTVNGGEVRNILSDSFGGLVTATATSLLFNSTQFVDVYGSLSIFIGMMYLDSCSLEVRGSHFSQFNATLFYTLHTAVVMSQSTFTLGGLYNSQPGKVVPTYGSALYAQNSPTVVIDYCEFVDLSADAGGAVYLAGQGTEKCEIVGTTATGNMGKSGGFLYSSSVHVSLTTCRLSHNSAENGGALWVTGEKDAVMVEMVNIRFEGNTARWDGGAVKSERSTYRTEYCDWVNNTAEYGPDIALSFAALSVLDNQTLAPIANYSISAVSGQTYTEELLIGCMDNLEQLIRTNNVSQLSLSIQEVNSSVSTNSLLVATKGVFRIPTMLLVAEPETTVTVYASLSQGFEQQLFTVWLRRCIPGEHYTEMQCKLCTHDTYSFHPSQECTLCPSHADCPEGNRLVLHSGYWRFSTSTDDLQKCLVKELCLGGYSSDCDEGHSGRMCSECSANYFKVSQLQCATCRSLGVAIVKDFLSMAIGVSSVLLAFRWPTALMTHLVVLDYLHTFRIIVNFNLYWPNSVAYLYAVLGDISSLGLTAFADPCLGTITDVKSVFSQLIVSVLFFSLLCAAAGAAGLVITQVRRDIKRRTVLRLVLYLGYLMLPLLFQRAMTLFPCYSIDSHEYLIFSPDVECWATKHLLYAMLVSVPVLVVAIAVPLGLMRGIVVGAAGLFAKMPRWKFFCLATYLLRKYAITTTLVFSNTMELPSQVCFVILLNLATELAVKTQKEPRNMFFFLLYEATLIASTLLAFVCGIYGSSESPAESKKAAFILANYGCALLPLLFILAFVIYKRKMQRKSRYIRPQKQMTIVDAPLNVVDPRSVILDGSSAQLCPPNPSPDNADK